MFVLKLNRNKGKKYFGLALTGQLLEDLRYKRKPSNLLGYQFPDFFQTNTSISAHQVVTVSIFLLYFTLPQN
jgi:hypothetical protein